MLSKVLFLSVVWSDLINACNYFRLSQVSSKKSKRIHNHVFRTRLAVLMTSIFALGNVVPNRQPDQSFLKVFLKLSGNSLKYLLIKLNSPFVQTCYFDP